MPWFEPNSPSDMVRSTVTAPEQHACDYTLVTHSACSQLLPPDGLKGGSRWLTCDWVLQVTSTARQAFRRAVLEGGPRLVEAMFLCQVSTASEALSGVAACLAYPS